MDYKIRIYEVLLIPKKKKKMGEREKSFLTTQGQLINVEGTMGIEKPHLGTIMEVADPGRSHLWRRFVEEQSTNMIPDNIPINDKRARTSLEKPGRHQHDQEPTLTSLGWDESPPCASGHSALKFHSIISVVFLPKKHDLNATKNTSSGPGLRVILENVRPIP